MFEININTSKSYSVYIESEPVESLRNKILCENSKYLVVISEKVEKLYGKMLNIPAENKFILKDGENQKNFKNYQNILDKAFKLKLTRKDSFIAIGGGVVGDITGFAASTYMRGIKYIQVPTTLLACVDSSVGGKTAINTKYGKNLVGCFYQPDVVYINPTFLKTLDEKQYKSGLGEIIKYGFIEKNCLGNYNFLNFLSEKHISIIKRDEKTLSDLIQICVNLKKYVVERDERESDLRRVLNFGHTWAHAVELITNYKKYTHGEAVIDGIKYAFELALNKGLTDESYKFFAFDLIQKYGYKDLPKFNVNKMNNLMKLDKKADSFCVRFVLPCEYATVKVCEISV